MPDNDNTEGNLADHTHHVYDEVPTSLARRVRKEDPALTPVKPDDLSDPRTRRSLVAAVQEGLPNPKLPQDQMEQKNPVGDSDADVESDDDPEPPKAS